MSNMNFKKAFSGLTKVLDNNAPTIATFGSIVGVGLTIFFMHKASKAAAAVEEKYEEKVDELMEHKAEVEKMSEDEVKQEKTRLKMDKAMRLVYIYRWALLSGIGSAGFAALSNYLNGRTIAGLTTLLALNQDKLQKGAEKLKEMVGEEKFQQFKEGIETDILGDKIKDTKVEKSKLSNSEDADAENYTDFCVPWSGERYKIPYNIVDDEIKKYNKLFAEDKLAYLDYNTWRTKIRIPSAPAWRNMVWNSDNPFKARIGDVNFDGTCMKAIIFVNDPIYERSLTR